MPNSKVKNIYVHHNHRRQEIREFLLQNSNHSTRPVCTVGKDKGLLYFDTDINKIICWTGSRWKIVDFFDERDLNTTDNVTMQDVWKDSYAVSNLSENEAKGLTGSQSIVQYWENESTTHIAETWAFTSVELLALILPKVFPDFGLTPYPDFYKPIVKNSVGTVISDQYYVLNEYREGKITKMKIEFLDGGDMAALGISALNPPTITFFKYVGERLTLTYINGSISKFQYMGITFLPDPLNVDSYRISLVGTGITSLGQVHTFSANGQELSPVSHYKIYEDGGNYYLSLDISTNGTNWIDEGRVHDDDFFYLYARTG